MQSPRERLSALPGQRRDGGKKRRNRSGGAEGHGGVPGTARPRERASARRGGAGTKERNVQRGGRGGAGAAWPSLALVPTRRNRRDRAGRGSAWSTAGPCPPPPSSSSRSVHVGRRGHVRAAPAARSRAGETGGAPRGGGAAPGIPNPHPGIRAAAPGPSEAAIAGCPGRRRPPPTAAPRGPTPPPDPPAPLSPAALHSRLAMSPPILYLVTTRSSAMVSSAASSSPDMVGPGPAPAAAAAAAAAPPPPPPR